MQNVTVPSSSPFLLRDAKKSAGVLPKIMLDAELYLPEDREAPYPAVVISQGLGGLKDVRERRYARFLARNGYAAIIYDGFVSRGKHRFSDTIRALRVTESMLLADAFAGLRYLAGRNDIRSDAISVIGFSYGGMITTLTAYDQIARLFLPDGQRFASHVAYYGPSVPRLNDPRTTGAPVAIMLGELDANFDMMRMRMIAADLERGGSKVDLTVFENIYHQWDGRDVERRFVNFNLASCRMRINTDDQVDDERTGMRMNGMISRTAILGCSVSRNGYFIKKDDATRQRSDEILLSTLSGVSEAGSGSRDNSAARAKISQKSSPEKKLLGERTAV